MSVTKTAQKKKFHFIAGLPRSGSTLLGAILGQNPRFHSGPSSPVLSSMLVLDDHIQKNELFVAYPKPEQAKQMVGSIIHNYYFDTSASVVFDLNRAWPSKIEMIESLLGHKVKILCPVRDLSEVLTSMISMVRRNPFQEGKHTRINFLDEQLVKLNIAINDENRCAHLVGPRGIVGQSAVAMKEAIDKGFRDRLYFVEYTDLVKNPEGTLDGIYKFLGEKSYHHDFENICNNHRVNDLGVYGIGDMHEVRSKVGSTSKDPSEVLSTTILEKCKGSEFWRGAPQKLFSAGISL